MRIETAIEALIATATEIEVIVGDETYQTKLQQTPHFPAIVLIKDRVEEIRTLSGPTGLYRTYFDIVCLTNTDEDTQILRQLVQDTLTAFRGDVSDEGSPPTYIDIQGIFFEGGPTEPYDPKDLILSGDRYQAVHGRSFT